MNSITNQTTAIASNRFDGQIDMLRMKSTHSDAAMSEEEMRKIADGFEGMIFRQLLKEMRKTVPKEGLLGESFATEMYTEIVDDHLAEQLAETHDLGLDRLIYDELKQRNSQNRKPGEERSTAFHSLHRDGQEPTEIKFIPLAGNTDDFIELHNRGQRMFQLPKRDPFMPLTGNLRLGTDRIENPR